MARTESGFDQDDIDDLLLQAFELWGLGPICQESPRG